MPQLTYNQAKELEAKALVHLLEKYEDAGELDKALLDWAADGAAYGADVEDANRLTGDEWEAILDCVQDKLEECDCAGCNSPASFYTQRMVEELAEVWDEVDEALQEYHDATGENWQPQGYRSRKPGGLTVGVLLWFAYEWRASQLANWLDGEKGVLALELADKNQ